MSIVIILRHSPWNKTPTNILEERKKTQNAHERGSKILFLQKQDKKEKNSRHVFFCVSVVDIVVTHDTRWQERKKYIYEEKKTAIVVYSVPLRVESAVPVQSEI